MPRSLVSMLGVQHVYTQMEMAEKKRTDTEQKNPAASALGKLGGPARAAKLSAKRRREIAKKAAEARWSKKKS